MIIGLLSAIIALMKNRLPELGVTFTFAAVLAGCTGEPLNTPIISCPDAAAQKADLEDQKGDLWNQSAQLSATQEALYRKQGMNDVADLQATSTALDQKLVDTSRQLSASYRSQSQCSEK